MARVTQVQQIERENEQQALAFFETMLARLPDPRRRQGVRYPLKVERRTVTLCRDLSWLSTAERWPELSFVVKVERERTVQATQKTSIETAFYIGSGSAPSATEVARFIRGHWSIETGLHWVLDVAFHEDHLRHRAKNTAQNMTTLRYFAINIIKQDNTRKVGVATARKRAGWDRNYLISLLLGSIA